MADLEDAFESVGFAIDDACAPDLQALANAHGKSAEDLAELWEAFAMNRKLKGKARAAAWRPAAHWSESGAFLFSRILEINLFHSRMNN